MADGGKFGFGGVWRSGAASAPGLLLVSLCFTFIALGILRTEIATWKFDDSPLSAQLEQKVELQGKVIQEPDYREKSVHLYVETANDVVLVTADRLSNVNYGDIISVAGKLTKPEEFTTELGRTFNYPGYLMARGVQYKISFATVAVLETRQGNPIVAALLDVKRLFITSLEQVIFEPQVGLGEGLLLGVKSSLGEDIEENFRRTGIIHIVVLSGYNVMLVVAFFMLLFSFFLPLRVRIIAGIISIAAFALIVGLSATVVRASIMVSLVLIAQASGRRYDVLRGLLFAGMVMIFVNPFLLLYDIGFQLSFMATLGLLLIVPQFEVSLVKTSNLWGIRDFFLATVATQIAVLPLLMFHIGQVSLISVVVNVLVLPLVPVAMLLTFISGLVGFFSGQLAGLIGYLASISLNYILMVADWFAHVPLAAVTVPQFSALGVLVMYGLMAVGLVIWRNKKITAVSLSARSLNLSDWVIEEEVEKAGQSQKHRPTNPEPPIFFR
ncbi:ComEC/Rec2 family competence protein [Candidatus Nomurabacteria bacterium]|nr:ComEC/Rec2 family competence protein [Candidatus Nomurabacteria bacterium]